MDHSLLMLLLAFLFGVLRVPVAVLQLTGVLAADMPAWYVPCQGWHTRVVPAPT